MTNIIKAAQDALDALEVRCGTCAEERQPGGVIDALRAALQDKAGEVRGERKGSVTFSLVRTLTAEKNKLNTALELACGYLTDEQVEAVKNAMPATKADSPCDVPKLCAEMNRRCDICDPPLAAQPALVAPEFKGVARRKLIQLAGDGWQINGYAIRRGDERGFIDASGFVGWWHSEHAPVAPGDAECLDWIERQHLEELGMGLVIDAPNDGQYYVCGDSGTTHYGKTLRDAIKGAITAQQKGGDS